MLDHMFTSVGRRQVPPEPRVDYSQKNIVERIEALSNSGVALYNFGQAANQIDQPAAKAKSG
jgi:hypothetical protein